MKYSKSPLKLSDQLKITTGHESIKNECGVWFLFSANLLQPLYSVQSFMKNSLLIYAAKTIRNGLMDKWTDR